MNYKILKDAIKSSGLQRKEIAERSNITPKTIDNILAGGDPKVSTLEAIANVIGIKIGLLFDEDVQIRQAQRDYVEKGKIIHNGAEYNSPVTVHNEELVVKYSELERVNAELNRKLIAAQERIITLMEKEK